MTNEERETVIRRRKIVGLLMGCELYNVLAVQVCKADLMGIGLNDLDELYERYEKASLQRKLAQELVNKYVK